MRPVSHSTLFNMSLQPPQPQPSPSYYEFYILAVQNYSQHLLHKIHAHLNSNKTSETIPVTSQTYPQIDNQQLSRRGFYLNLVYDYLQLVRQISSQFNQHIKHQTHLEKWEFRGWVQHMVLSIEELNGLSSLRKRLSEEGKGEMRVFMGSLLNLLFDTQIYILQILFRIFLYELIVSQNKQYCKQMMNINTRYKGYVLDQLNTQKQGNIYAKQKWMNRSTIMILKKLVKEIQRLSDFYLFQLSSNRFNAKDKPEINSLFQLLKDKVNQDVMQRIIRKTRQFKNLYQSQQQIYANNTFSPFIVKSINKQSNGHHQDKQLDVQKEVVPASNLDTPKVKLRQTDKQQVTPQKFKSQPTKSVHTLSENMRLITKTAQPKEQPNKQYRKEPLSPKELKNDDKSMNKELKGKCSFSKPSASNLIHKMNKLNTNERIKYIGMNQRYGQGTSNLLGRIMKPKKERDEEQDFGPSISVRDKKEQFQGRQRQVSSNNPQELPNGFFLTVDQTPSEGHFRMLPRQRRC